MQRGIASGGNGQRTGILLRGIPPNLEIDGGPTCRTRVYGPNRLDVTPDEPKPSPVFTTTTAAEQTAGGLLLGR